MWPHSQEAPRGVGPIETECRRWGQGPGVSVQWDRASVWEDGSVFSPDQVRPTRLGRTISLTGFISSNVTPTGDTPTDTQHHDEPCLGPQWPCEGDT